MSDRTVSKERRRLVYQQVHQAVREGVLVPSEDCEQCGRIPGPDDPPLHSHHWLGYEDPVALVVDWLCESCHQSLHMQMRDGLSEAASEANHRWWAQFTPDERSQMMSERNRAAWARRTPEERSRIVGERSRKAWASLTPEERQHRTDESARRLVQATVPPEARSRGASERNRTVWGRFTPEERSRILRERWAAIPPEVRSERARRAAATRRRNKSLRNVLDGDAE